MNYTFRAAALGFIGGVSFVASCVAGLSMRGVVMCVVCWVAFAIVGLLAGMEEARRG